MSNNDRKIKRNKDKILQKEQKQHENFVFNWAERELDLNLPVDQLLFQLSMNFIWWTQKWTSLTDEHRGVLKVLFIQNPYVLYHINEILKKNIDKNQKVNQTWLLTEAEAKLMMTLALLDDTCEIDIQLESIENV